MGDLRDLRYELDLCHEDIVTDESTFLHAVKYLTIWKQHEKRFWDERMRT